MSERDRRLAEAVGLREAGQAEEARPLLVALAAQWPEDAEVQYQTAWAHDFLGLEAEAVPYYERALALGIAEPDREGLVLGLGSTYRNVGRYADAVTLLTAGVSEYPENAAMRCFLALAQLSAGQADAALASALSVVLDICPDASVQRYRRALSWYRDDLLGIADPEG